MFKSTGNSHHPGHVKDTASECKPDYTAAFQSHWGGKNTTLWPCIRLVGKAASRGKSRESQEEQANSYMHHLLLARPDLHVAQGLFTDNLGVTFLFGIGGLGICDVTVLWKSKDLYRLMYAFIYRLYDPGDFADSSYLRTEINPEVNLVTFTVRVRTGTDGAEEVICPNLVHISASNPFGTRTNILSNPNSEVKINGEPLTVLKEQLCQVDSRFEEHSILSQIHSPERVPGVVEPVWHGILEDPHCESRKKHQLGLRQSGKSFMSIPTLQQMLEIVFDILEGSLFL